MLKKPRLYYALHLLALFMLVSSGCRRPCNSPSPTPRFNGPWEYTIGIYTGSLPWRLSPIQSPLSNPVLTAKDVTDIPASFVADPFMVHENNKWYMFFEALNAPRGEGAIALATSRDGFKWQYEQIVLEEPYHLSYPCVFKWQTNYFMIPESYRADGVRLYKANPFPTHWTFITNILEGVYIDPTIFRYNDIWWLFSSCRGSETLFLHYARNLTGPWHEHPESPVITHNKDIARPGGRVIQYNGKLYRFPQDCAPLYGNQVRVFEITKLTPQEYEDCELDCSPVLTASGKGWNAQGMHQIDPHPLPGGGWIACVDGVTSVLPEYPAYIAFENGAELEGVTLFPEDQAYQDGYILMRLYWKYTDDTVTSNIHTFVHFQREDYRFQGDHPLPPHECVKEQLIKIPGDAPVGRYDLIIGLYHPDTKERIDFKTCLPHRKQSVFLPKKFRILKKKAE